MKTKLFYLIIFALVTSFSANAQLDGKKFSTIIEGIGEFNLKFSENVYELSSSANVVVVKGNYEINEKTIAFNDIEGPMACPEDVIGKYEFEYTNEKLTLKVIEDPCMGRNNMASTIWKEVN